MAKLKEGDKAPSFKLPDENKKVRDLSDFKGKTVILYFLSKRYDSRLHARSSRFSRCLVEIFKKKKAVILGVSKDSPERHQKFIEKEKINFTLLADEDTKSLQTLWGL